MKTKESQKTASHLLRVIRLGLAVIVLGYLTLQFYLYSFGDPIEKIGIDTRIRLQGYRLGMCDNTCMGEWFAHYHEEAPGTQVMIEFLLFGLDHPELLKKILYSLPSHTKNKVIEGLIFQVTDLGKKEEFKKTLGFDVVSLKDNL